jgi:cell pole-organizing protein PopZ
MSEPMTSVEIEDVLASIRRLVSEDLRPPITAQRSVAFDSDNGLGKLVLTPALRVHDPATAPMVLGKSDLAVVETSSPSLGHVVSQLGARVDEDDWEAEAPFTDTDWSEGNSTEPDDAPRQAPLAEVVPFVLAHERRLQAAWRDGAWAEPRKDATDPVPESAAEEAGEVAEAPVPSTPVVEEAQPTAAPLDAAEVQPEAEVSSLDAAEEELAADVEEHLTARAMNEVPRVFAPGDADDFDEEALREVVRDIIRDELQGALGERITRAVRKLVRTEIQRMLISRDVQ